MSAAAREVELAARESYGKLVAILAARTRDIAAAEDALSEAFAAALAAWPRGGLPERPEALLFAAARRRLIDRARRARTAMVAEPALRLALEEVASMTETPGEPDPRLGLLFACAHPAIEPGVRPALMLQTVLGLSAERIAAAYLAEPAAIGQRLVRAKRKIKEAGVPFAVPERAVWPERMGAVLDAVYAAFTEAWGDPAGRDAMRGALGEEAIWLARVLAAAAPEEPEALGLLALLLHLEARKEARRGPDGAYVPLEAQDCALWREDLIEEAERLLFRAAQARAPGRYQLEAAIQSAHAVRRRFGAADWPAILGFYDALLALTASPVAALNRAAALERVAGPAAALEALAPIAERLAAYQPYWALRAHLLKRLGRADEARAAYDEAIARESDPAVRAYLAGERDASA